MRISVPAADALLDIAVPVLDHGSVTLVDYLGSDLRIVQSARGTRGKDAKNDDLVGNQRLINYMMRMGHTSPFEKVVLEFQIKLPIFVMRQFVRHRTARLNEISGRYSELPAEYYVPDPADIGTQDTKNRQGRVLSSDPDWTDDMRAEIADQGALAFASYRQLLLDGVARELARLVLPVTTYTSCYWQMDLNNLFHFLKLRLDSYAQYEIRVYAQVIAQAAQAVAPMAYAAFEEYVLGAVTLSASRAKELGVSE